MKNIFKLGLVIFTFMVCAMGVNFAEAKTLVFSNEQAQTSDTGEFVIDVQNYTDDIDLKFGASIDARIRFNRISDTFEINRSVDLTGNQLQNFKLENLSTDPVCDASSVGRMYYNTVNHTTHVCDGTNFNQLENILGNDTVEFPALQIRRTSAYTLQTTYQDVDLDTTDLANEVAVLEHDGINADRILVKENGMYQIIYGYSAGGTATATHEAKARVRANDTTVLPGSDSVNKNYQGEFSTTSASFLANLTAGDFISLQLQRDGTADTTQGDVYFSIIKLEGVKGDKGEDGDSGANNIQITQAAHGFTLANGIPKPAHINISGNVALSQANAADTLIAFYITEIIDADNFMVQLDGILEVPAHGLNVGEYYFLDASAAGNVTGTAPVLVDVAFYVIDNNNLALKDNRPQISLADPDTHSLDSADGSVVDAVFVENSGEVKLNTVNTDNTATEMLVLDGSGSGVIKKQLMPNPIDIVQIRNSAQTNANNSTTGTAIQYNTGTAINTNNSLFVPLSNGVRVTENGIYKVEASLYQTTTAVTRSNVSIQASVNGAKQGVIGASGYIRRTAGHNESSSHVSQLFSLSANDVIGLQAIRLAATGTITTPANTSALIITRIK